MSEAVERLRAQIEDVQRISGNPWRQLLGFFAHNPFWPWEWDNWHRQVDATRKALDDHKKVARTLAAQIDKNRGSVGLG
jgi:hypothetical protein